jgi:hypothetical protein
MFRSLSYFTTDSQSVSQSVCLGIEYPCGTCDQILFPVGMLLSEINLGIKFYIQHLWNIVGNHHYISVHYLMMYLTVWFVIILQRNF